MFWYHTSHVTYLITSGALLVHKATIMPRGSALGMVSMLSEKDELSWSRKQLMARLDVAMGGRVAEEIIFGAENVTSGMHIIIATQISKSNTHTHTHTYTVSHSHTHLY